MMTWHKYGSRGRIYAGMCERPRLLPTDIDSSKAVVFREWMFLKKSQSIVKAW